MRSMVGLALTGLVAGACGHATPTGSAQNGWRTPTGYASATNPRYINPDAAAHPARDRSVFEERQAPPQQPVSSEEPRPAETTAPMATEPPPGPVPPPAETRPPPETVPDTALPYRGQRLGGPPYLQP